ncbi:MAG: hypothetical protein C5B50_10055 [Verrucomicrobia bacterium]|nr:MAG: hypothetical protein C5B50_10055 [Verrucomicrobiota bacterium]
MRIALIATSLRLAGAEKQFVYLARALSAAGVEARVFYLGGGDHYQTILTEMGIPLRQIFNEGRPLIMLARLIKELSLFKPNVVLASQFGDLIFAAPAARLCNALVLGGVRSDGFYELNRGGRRSWFMLRLAHGLIANSYRAKKNLESKGINPAKITVLPNVINLTEFDAQAALPFSKCAPADRLLVAAVGSLQASKRFDRFLNALALASAKEPRIFGVIAGKDLGAGSALRQRAASLGLDAGKLLFLGEADHIPALLSHCRLLVLCSDYEGFPNVILEAMAARLPVITTPAGDAAVIVENGVTGYVVQDDDCHAMADHMVRLIQNPDLSSKLGAAGRKRLEQEYDAASLAPRVLSAFSGFARQHRRKKLFNRLEHVACAMGYSERGTSTSKSGPLIRGVVHQSGTRVWPTVPAVTASK